jgi:hypothetical protein
MLVLGPVYAARIVFADDPAAPSNVSKMEPAKRARAAAVPATLHNKQPVWIAPTKEYSPAELSRSPATAVKDVAARNIAPLKRRMVKGTRLPSDTATLSFAPEMPVPAAPLMRD